MLSLINSVYWLKKMTVTINLQFNNRLMITDNLAFRDLTI